MPWIEANGVTLHYRLDGPADAPPLVLIHELGGSLASWDRVMGRVGDRRVLRWDWRGAGLSEKIRGELSIDTLCADLAALMAGVGLDRPADVAGTALGGGVALAFAARAPERVRRLVVSSPAIGGARAIEDMLRARADQVEREGMRGQVDISLDRSYLPKYRTDPAAFAEYRARWIANDPASYAGHNRMLAAMDERRNLARIACPTLVLAGSDDGLLVPDAMREIAEAIPGAQFQELATGHFLAVNTPDLWAAIAPPFFNRESRLS